MVADETKTMRDVEGKHCKNNSHTKALSGAGRPVTAACGRVAGKRCHPRAVVANALKSQYI